MKMNLSKLEEVGLKWLQKKVKNSELSVCKADKGGSTLLVPPSLLSKKIEEKVYDEDLYDKLDEDPRKVLYDNLIDLMEVW